MTHEGAADSPLNVQLTSYIRYRNGYIDPNDIVLVRYDEEDNIVETINMTLRDMLTNVKWHEYGGRGMRVLNPLDGRPKSGPNIVDFFDQHYYFSWYQ
jgi:hypothetical protein